MKRIVLFLAAGFLVAMTVTARGWDTDTAIPPKLEIGEPLFAFSSRWQSIYSGQDKSPDQRTITNFFRNEHAELSDLALQRIGAPQLVMAANHQLTVLDLNANLFRPDLLKRGLGPAPKTFSRLEHRVLPSIPHWSGIPDFSYSIEDWINKNTYCPSRPPGDVLNVTCHGYALGWLGAFNSSHFGSQAAKNYRSLHATALDLADKARKLRLLIATGDAGENLEEHRDAIEEAEFMALYYEAVAQHYLQDRWATGHMWERWGAPDYWQSPIPHDPWAATEIAMASGLMHGSEAMSKLPDPASSPFGRGVRYAPDWTASSPIPLTREIEVPKFRVDGRQREVSGVGDERLKDMFRGKFGSDYLVFNYRDVALDVQDHRDMMMDCLASSWAQIVRAFGRQTEGQGFGKRAIVLAPPYDGNYWPPHACDDAWIVNRSVFLGWAKDLIVRIGSFSRIAFADVPSNDQRAPHRSSWALASARIGWFEWRDPSGTDLAKGNVGSFRGVGPARDYGQARYLPPHDLATLPDRDPSGLDKAAVFGFFNRANANELCPKVRDLVRPLRGSKEETDIELCVYLADRLWFGTDPRYQGTQREQRGGIGSKVRPICSFFGGPVDVASGAYDEDTPYFLHPGYVPRAQFPLNTGSSAPVGQKKAQSLVNWCRKTPVVNPEPALRDADVIAQADDLAADVAVSGLNFGPDRGKVHVALPNGSAAEATIRNWSDDTIQFQVTTEPTNSGDYLIVVERSDGQRSEGRFVLRVR